ncbi:PIN domain-like protein [Ganoderma leucocontextum]|nr:PIN domain-like protein [Ganoderma leucocontextum]
MGVKGFGTFLERRFPQVVQYLPERLAALSGKRIVIDATLITQRFHFAPVTHPYRHVLFWYRLAKHLKSNNVQAICVFDGGHRSVAKGAELERRRQERRLVAARSLFEIDRLERLRRVSTSLREWRSPGLDQLQQDLTTLKLITEISKPPTAPLPATWYKSDEFPGNYERPPKDQPPSLQAGISIPSSNRGELESEADKQVTLPESHAERPDRQTPGLPTRLSRMLVQYLESIPTLSSLTQPPADVKPEVPPPIVKAIEDIPKVEPPAILPTVVLEEDVEDAKEEYALSKSQQSLTDEEGKLWDMIAETATTDGIPESTTKYAEDLEAKSAVLSESYQRRQNPPTSSTYAESKEILAAMGIPCIEPVGAFEGEALAASLVLNGHADYVASEDTDVLVYGAPLIRNIASGAGPLSLITGNDVRTALGLDDAAFVDFVLLVGTDFSTRIKNLGPVRALKFVREHGTIERVLERETRYPLMVPLEFYLERIALARTVFQTLPPISPDMLDFGEGRVDEDEVLAILDRCDLRRFAMEDQDYSQSLSGNYFGDNPTAA